MNIVDVKEIPQNITESPLDDLLGLYKTCQKLEELCKSLDGIGLAAPQVGIPWKLFVLKSDGGCKLVPNQQFGYFVNCDYRPTTEEQVVSLEGCLSVRSPEGQLRLFQMKRYTTIHITGLLLTDDMKMLNIDDGFDFRQQCVVFQHEIDHQYGRLISDVGKEVFLW